MRIDLNSDVGETFGPWTMGNDDALMPHVTSANVACGFHAGDPTTLRHTIRLAKRHGVAVGAHPGFPDLVGFGRREIKTTPQDIEDFVMYQIAAIAGVAAAEGLRLQHVKAHGALYNMACRDRAMADAIARAVAALDHGLILFGLPNSELLRAGEAAGLRVAAEGFADRAYEADGSLASRQKAGSVIHDRTVVVERAIKMVKERAVVAVDGSTIAFDSDTICLHGDTAGAAELAREIRRGLEDAGVRVQSLDSQR